jgi:formate--tetrahydrofolate ligase
MTVLLKDAMQPNLVQTLENNPAFVHGGPFANIAHGCNSVVATTTALKLADYVVTEAGFGADLGAEKFFDIKCRKAGLKPDAAVIVATVRAHEDERRRQEGRPRPGKRRGGEERAARISAAMSRTSSQFGVPVVVAINHFISDTDAEIQAVKDYVATIGAEAILCKHWAQGSAGIEELARKVVELAESGIVAVLAALSRRHAAVREDRDDRQAHLSRRRGRHRRQVGARPAAAGRRQGYGNLPVCMAKTQYSFSTDPNLRGAPSGHTVPVREVRLSAGAGFVVVICGEIMTMPGLPKVPSSEKIFLNEQGQIEGLF